jgi:hypothetical protein
LCVCGIVFLRSLTTQQSLCDPPFCLIWSVGSSFSGLLSSGGLRRGQIFLFPCLFFFVAVTLASDDLSLFTATSVVLVVSQALHTSGRQAVEFRDTDLNLSSRRLFHKCERETDG